MRSNETINFFIGKAKINCKLNNLIQYNFMETIKESYFYYLLFLYQSK